jgi:putative transposase
LRRWLGNLPSLRTAHPTELSDAEWFCLDPYMPSSKVTGRPRLHHTCEILDAVLYVLESGCAWRKLFGSFVLKALVRVHFHR